MSNLRPAIRFASGLYRQRAGLARAGQVRRRTGTTIRGPISVPVTARRASRATAPAPS
jgi:hypothetical protein